MSIRPATTSNRTGVRHIDVRGRQSALDAALGLCVAAFAIAVLAIGFEGEATTGSYAAAALAGLAVALRRRQVGLALVVVVAARLFVTWDAGEEIALVPAVVVVLYTIARHGERITGIVSALLAVAVMGLPVAALSDERFVTELLTEVAVGSLPIAVADAGRSRAERVRDLIEAEATARVQAERLRLARDLHDVVAHGMSMIAVQSGVAAHLFDRDPDQARDALEAINAAGKQSLEELRTMLGVLRSTDEAELRPVPADPDDLDVLVADARRAGVEVACEVEGAFPPDASDASVVAVHRIIQEALTNVARHAGPVPAHLRLRHRPDHVLAEILNGRPVRERPPGHASGVGIIGMRERAESLGGSLEASADERGGFRVVAIIPYQPRQLSAPHR